MKFKYDYGSTPLDPNEIDGLIPLHIQTMSELNAFEHANILMCEQWAQKSKFDVSMRYIKKLHLKMFDKTWKWAGSFRKTGKNVGVDAYRIETDVAQLCDDIQFQMYNHIYDLTEIAVRAHHKLTYIHAFPNGNGRHARLFTDIFLYKNHKKPFSWGSKTNLSEEARRKKYIQALRQADQHDYSYLLNFIDS